MVNQDNLNDVVQLVKGSFAGSYILTVSSKTDEGIDGLTERIKLNVLRAEREKLTHSPLMEPFQDQSAQS